MPALAPIALLLMATGFFTATYKAAHGTVALTWAAASAVTVGLALRFLAPENHSMSNSPSQLITIVVWAFAIPALVLAGFWALERVDLFRGLGVAFLGATASVILNAEEFAWKGNLGIYCTLFLLALTARNVHWTRLILLGSAAGNALSDARTMALVSVIVLICTFVSRRQIEWAQRKPTQAMLGLIGGFLMMSYLMAQAMLSGLLGEDIRRRTLLQVSGGRDLITAGRTEWAATLELFKQAPWGFGVGVTPGPGLQTNAIGAVQMAGGDYSNLTYWTHSVFGERTDLHSTLANLWVHFGLGGVVLAAAIAVILATATSHSVRFIRTVGAVPLFSILTAAWDLLFSPMGNVDRIVAGLLLSVVMIRLHRNSERPAAPQNTPASQGPTGNPRSVRSMASPI